MHHDRSARGGERRLDAAGRFVTSSPHKAAGLLALCTGMPRSASTWSFNICKGLLRAAAPEVPVEGYYREALPAEEIADLVAARNLVVKCHDLNDASRAWLATLAPTSIRFIYTYRDPRETIASAMMTFGRSFAEQLGSVERSLIFLDFQRRLGSVCVVPYESIMTDSLGAVSIIARYVGLGLSPSQLAWVNGLCARQSLEAVTRQFDQFPESEIYQDESYAYHLPTLLHRNHFRPKDAPGWQELLTPEQLREIAALVEPWAELFAGETARITDREEPQGKTELDPLVGT